MKVLESAQSPLRYYILKDSTLSRLAPVALPLFAIVGLLFLQYRYGLMSLAGRLFPGNNQTFPELFSQALDEGIPSRPVLKTGAAYDSLIQRRAELSAIQQDQLFYAELLSVCNEDGKLIHPDKVQELALTFRTRPEENWSSENQRLYRSIILEKLSLNYGIHYDAEKKMKSVNIKGQNLTVQIVDDDGDCLFHSFIKGLTSQHTHTPESLRILASAALCKALERPDPEGLMQQLAEGMRMHNAAHSGQESSTLVTIELLDFETLKVQFSNDPELKDCTNKEDLIKKWRLQNLPVEDTTPAPELAQQFCKLLAQPRTIYPGEETIMILAESLEQPTIIVNGESIHCFGPKADAPKVPIMIYKTPGNAHYNRLSLSLEQWQAISAEFKF